MRSALRLILWGGLWLAAAGGGGCTQDFRVRPAPSAATARTGPAPGPSAEQCRRALLKKSGSAAERRQATDRLIDLYAPALLAAPGHAVRVPTGAGRSFSLRLRQGDGPGGMDPTCYVALEPADRFVVTGVDHPSVTPGEGAPLVGTLRPVPPVNSPGTVPSRPVSGFKRAATAVATIGKTSPDVTLSLYDPHTTGRAPGPNGASRPLAADYTTSLALELAHFRPQRRSLRGFLSGGGYFPDTGMYALEKPTPDKAPLVFVHGLISDPGDFHSLINDLADDAEVRRRYQVWIFYYPTSLPVAYAAMLLREDVEQFIRQLDPAGTHPALHRAVLAGHSMGGLLCRFAVSDGGDRFYRHFFRQPAGQLRLSPPDRELLRRTFYYRACPDVAQVVFIATPHRGSILAVGPLGNVGRLLLHMPSAVRGRLHDILANNRDALATRNHLQPGSSLDSLTPRGPVVAAVNDLPLNPKTRLHSILGDRGRGGPPERSSDGVVPYASSHLPQAESEVLVPAGHTGTLHRPETTAELVRILVGGRGASSQPPAPSRPG